MKSYLEESQFAGKNITPLLKSKIQENIFQGKYKKKNIASKSLKYTLLFATKVV